MVYLVRHQKKLYTHCLTHRGQELVEYIFEGLLIVACMLFVVGSVYFFPGQDTEKVACRLYDCGSIIFGLLSLFSSVEGYWLRKVRRHRRRNVLQSAEQTLHLMGSMTFMTGTLIWDPGFQRPSSYMTLLGVLTFMVGSFLFSLAAFLNAMLIMQGHPRFMSYSLFVALCFHLGSLLFVTGTVGFVPGTISDTCNAACDNWMENAGCACYLAGSCFFFLGSVLNLLKTIALNQLGREQRKAARKIQEQIRRYVISPKAGDAKEIQQGYETHMGKKKNREAVRVNRIVEKQRKAKRAARKRAAKHIERFWLGKHKEIVAAKKEKEAAAVIQQFWLEYQQQINDEDAADRKEAKMIAEEFTKGIAKKLTEMSDMGIGLDDDDYIESDDSSSSNESEDEESDDDSGDDEKPTRASMMEQRARTHALKEEARTTFLLPTVWRAVVSAFEADDVSEEEREDTSHRRSVDTRVPVATKTADVRTRRTQSMQDFLYLPLPGSK